MSDIIRAQFQLKCQLFPALFHIDKNEDKYQIIKSDEKVSEYMFPMIVQVIKCGSRAEQIYLDFSDIDYIYEVGPLLVGRKRFLKNKFYFNTAKIPGFYTVCDEKGGYLYPMSLQSSFASVIHGVKQLASLETTSAALPSIPLPPGTLREISSGLAMQMFIHHEWHSLNFFGMGNNQVKSDEDSVIALKCQKWPKDVWKKFKKRKPGHMSFQQLKETPLYLIPKAHPNSEKPSLEWKLSFTLVEKKIFERVPYILRKVYLLCKNLTRIWKVKYNFPSYVLKTVFLWNYEEWQKSENEFTEDDILDVMLKLFSDVYEYYKKGVLPMYFIPEVNLLDQYTKTENENVITEVKAVANLQSLSSFICTNSLEPFREKFFTLADPYYISPHRRLNLMCRGSNSRVKISYYNLQYLYSEKIHQNKSISDNEDKLEFLHELYVTFLFLLVDRIFDYSYQSNDEDLFNYLYYLMVYGCSYIPNNIISSGVNNFIVTYTESIKEFLSVCFPGDVCLLIHTVLLPRACSLDEKIKVKTKEILHKRYKKEDLTEMWINGDFDNHDISFVHEMYRFGNKEHCENLHKCIMEHNFSKFDLVFESLVNNLNSYFSRSFKSRCLKEIAMAGKDWSSSYFLKYLVQDMFEMYSYGFTDGKFHLPTPAVYMSYLRQLVVNMTCKVQNELNNGDRPMHQLYQKFRHYCDQASIIDRNVSDQACIIDGNIGDHWGFFVKERNYVTYHHRKTTTIPFEWTFS